MTISADTPHPPLVAARRVAASGVSASGARLDDFTYSVLPDPPAPTGGGERRLAARRRTRLRSGKVVGSDGQFVIECLIANRSTQGGLLRLPGVVALPSRILVYDDQSGELQSATVMWRRGRDLGIRFAPAGVGERYRAIADSMRRKFYAVRG